MVLKDILEKASVNDSKRSSNEQKYGDYYAACIDQAAIEQKGTSTLRPTMELIASVKTKAGLPRVISKLYLQGMGDFFSFGSQQDSKDSSEEIAFVSQGGLGLPDRDFYFRTDPKSVEIRSKYVRHIGKVFELWGERPAIAQKHAATIMQMESALAEGALDNVSRRDPKKVYNRMSVAALQQLNPSFDWPTFLRAVGVPQITSLNVAEPEFIRHMESLLNKTSLEDLKTHMRWQVLQAQPQFLPKAFDDESFDFNRRILAGQRQQAPRWRRCVISTDGDLGEAVGQGFVARAFPPESKERTLKLVMAIESALERDINEIPWMTDVTKQRALGKLHKIANKIGYPGHWRDYSALKIVRGDAMGNSLRANEFETRRQLAKIGKPVDKGEWNYSPPTVNAYYAPFQNNINFMAGILQPPFFDDRIDDAVNFGAIGAVIGHELTHGFDDKGRQFDGDGNLQDWWTAEDAKAFEERTSCEVAEYDQFTTPDGTHVNGKLTLGENTADNGGVRIAYMALMDELAKDSQQAQQSIDGLSPAQRFFVGNAQIWCANATEEALRLQVQTDPHSPGEFRVNGVLSNVPEFQAAFGCKAGQAMVRAQACRVW
jgi:putative endopeptidase